MSTQLVSYFQSQQDWRIDAPAEIISVDEARLRKKSGRAYYIPGQNGVMCEVPKFCKAPLDAELEPITSSRSEWKILGQTAKPGSQKAYSGPGLPVYQMV